MNICKRIGLYSREGSHLAARAFATGLKLHGHAGIHRSLSDYTPGQVEKFDAVLVLGLRGKGRTILEEYSERGIPGVVVDYGYLNRVNGEADYATGHWQVSLGGLNQLPEFACPADRFEALGLHLADPVERESGPVVLCGQHVGDAAHPFDTVTKLQDWVASVPHDEFRPHPLEGSVSEPLGGMLARAKSVVTWNSNVGNDALLAGVPVVALGDAMYNGVSMEDRAAYFARVAYGQWTIAEMAQGVATEFVVRHLIPHLPLEMPQAATEPASDLDKLTAKEMIQILTDAGIVVPPGSKKADLRAKVEELTRGA